MTFLAWFEFFLGCIGFMVFMAGASSAKALGNETMSCLAGAGASVFLCLAGMARLADAGVFTH